MEHLCGVQTRALRPRIHHLRTDGVGSFTQKAHCGLAVLANPVGQGEQGRGLGVVCSRIAQQDGFALTTHEGFGDGHRMCRCLGHRHRGGNALQLGQGRGHFGQGLGPQGGLGDPRLLNRHRPVPHALIDLHHLTTTPCGLANALGQQRLVFAHMGSHQQHTLKR